MGLSLTKLFQIFIDDLDRLSSFLKLDRENESPVWKAAREIAAEATKIDQSPVTYGRTGQSKILDASRRLGGPYLDDLTGVNYVPEVNNPQELLFAMIFYNQLQNYENISQGNPILLKFLSAEKPQVQRDAKVLKSRMDDYCSSQANLEAIYQAFPQCDPADESPILEQLAKLLARKSLEEKLVTQFEFEFDEQVLSYNENKDLEQFLKNLESAIKTKEDKLTEIAAYIKLVQLLKDKAITADNFKQSQDHKQFIPYWSALSDSIAGNKIVSYGYSAVRFTAQSAKWVGGWTYWGVSKALGWATPTVIQNTMINAANLVSGVVDGMTPETAADRANRLLISAAETKIADLAKELNSKADSKAEDTITALDFNDSTSEKVMELAEKTILIRRMVHIQKCMEQYKAEHSTNLVKLSLGVFNPITRLLSKTFFKRLMFDKVLLCMQVNKLQTRLDALIDKANKADNDKPAVEEVKAELESSLDKTKDKGHSIKNKSLFVFFKRESNKAHKQLEDIVDKTSSFIRKD